MNELQNVEKNIYSYITTEEIEFPKGINILGWNWSFCDHIKTSFYYKHGRLLNGNDDETPVKNITKPILNMQYWAEDIDVKDLVLYIENEDKYHLSFLLKKYHDDIFLKENDMDGLLDEVNQSRIDYGGGLTMNVGKARPQKINLEDICFCNQSNMLSSPIGFKMYFSPSDLQDMEARGWGDKKKGATHTIEETIVLSRSQSRNDGGNIKNPVKTQGKYIQVYVVIGLMPKMYIDDSESEKYIYQMQVVCFYQSKTPNKDSKLQKEGITLFASQCKNPFKLIKRDDVFGRCLGFGGVEEIFEPQAWTTYNKIQEKEIMDVAAKVLHITDDEEFVKRNHNLKGVVNSEVLFLRPNTTLKQMDTYPRSMVLLENSINDWQEYAQVIGGAPNPLLGKDPTSGTPFKLQDLVVRTGKSLHEWRVGQYAKFIEEMYRDWIIPYIAKEVVKGKKFLSSLSLDEMQKVSEGVVEYEINQTKKNVILSGQIFDVSQEEVLRQKIKEDFMKDNNKFLEILKDELKDAVINISINVSNKQKHLGEMADKMSNIFRQIFANPQGFIQVMQIPGAAKTFNQMLEYSNLSPISVGDFNLPVPQQQAINQQSVPAMPQQA